MSQEMLDTDTAQSSLRVSGEGRGQGGTGLPPALPEVWCR